MNYLNISLLALVLCINAENSSALSLRKRSLQETCGTLTCHRLGECITLGDDDVKCICMDGYEGNGITECIDEDECAKDYPCEERAKGGYCVDNDPPLKYSCGCIKGYVPDEDLIDPNHGALGCIEVNECVDGTHNCHSEHGVCTNTPGSFNCSCSDGYVGDGVETCDEVATSVDSEEEDACDPNPCNVENQVCQLDTTKDKGYNCTCIEGFYSPSGAGGTCQDKDECDLQTHNCDPNAKCDNIPGEWTCKCNTGYFGSGTNCTDIDECSQNSTLCATEKLCVNVPGEYECVDPTPAPTPVPTPAPTRKVVPAPEKKCYPARARGRSLHEHSQTERELACRRGLVEVEDNESGRRLCCPPT